MKTKREIILDAIHDTVKRFADYDRRNDEELSTDDIVEALERDEITIDEMAGKFHTELLKHFGQKMTDDEVKENRIWNERWLKGERNIICNLPEPVRPPQKDCKRCGIAQKMGKVVWCRCMLEEKVKATSG